MSVTLPVAVRVLLPHGQVEEIKLETYLAGAVAAEIGASAPLEALKAQTVASRTYVVSAQRHQEHNADVCTTAHCQKWKRVDPVTAPEVFRAVSETWAMIAIYEGKPINAFFFEHCDGHTRNAEEMLMPSLPYLRGVDCPCGFLAMRGHGVGMCKRGAIVMARRGASFEQILQHYYRGVVVIHAPRADKIIPEEKENQPVTPLPMPAEAKPRLRVRKKSEPVKAERRQTKAEREKAAARPAMRAPATPPETRAPRAPATPPETRAVPAPRAPASPPETRAPRIAPRPPRVEPEPTPAPLLKRITLPPVEPLAQVVAPSPRAPAASVPIEPPAEQAPLRIISPAPAPVSEPPMIPATPVAVEPVEPPTPRVPLDFPVIAPAAQSSEPAEPVSTARVQLDLPASAPVAPSSEPAEPAPASPRVPLDFPVIMPVAQFNAAASSEPAAPTHAPSAMGIEAATPRAPGQDGSTVAPRATPAPITSQETSSVIARRVHVDYLPGEKVIAGSLPRGGINLTIQDPHGSKFLIVSGSAPDYGLGGFEYAAEENGLYIVTVGGRLIEVDVHDGETAFIHADTVF